MEFIEFVRTLDSTNSVNSTNSINSKNGELYARFPYLCQADMATPNQKNRYDAIDSLELGQASENSFERVAGVHGWSVQPARGRHNIDEHWDYDISNGAQRFKVDVKAMKRLHRGDARVQDEWAWIELHGVREYDRGWLLDGKAELIAFERQRSFLLVERLKLIELVKRVVQRTYVSSPNDAQYKVYSRRGRNDKLTLVEFKIIERMKWQLWLK